jgi:hypothetical protein
MHPLAIKARGETDRGGKEKRTRGENDRGEKKRERRSDSEETQERQIEEGRDRRKKKQRGRR